MARIRTLKPAFWGSSTTAKMSRDARLLVLGLISFADDDGRFLGSLASIGGNIFPNDEASAAKLGAWLKETTARDMVHLYEVDGIKYGCFPRWHAHQRIDKYTPSTLPPPQIECVPRRATPGRGKE